MKERIVLDLASPILKTWASDSHFMPMILQKNSYRLDF